MRRQKKAALSRQPWKETTKLTFFLHLNRDWSPRFSTLRDKNGWVRAKTARNLNLGVSRNRFCDFLADPDSRSFSRFGAIILQFAVFAQRCFAKTGSGRQTQEEVDPKQPRHYVVAPRVEATALSRCPACQLQPPKRTHTHTHPGIRRQAHATQPQHISTITISTVTTVTTTSSVPH
jgi:hypothetical protein